MEQIAGSAELPLEHVAMALDQLNGAGLLASGMSDAPSTTSRRRLLRKAAAASAVPLLVSVSAPMSASATSGCGQYTKKWKCEQAGCKWKRGHCKPQWSSH